MSRRNIDYFISDDGIEDAATANSSVKKTKKTPAREAFFQGGAKQAARLLIALGPDQAASILKEMSEKEIEMLVKEMSLIKKLMPEEKEEILEEFGRRLESNGEILRGGPEAAREILMRGLGEKKAEEILGRLNRRDLKHDFHFLEQIEPNNLAAALMQEHPQVSAVALSFINPKAAAHVMKAFPDDFRSQVALRIARTTNTHPDAVQRVAQVLREKFEKRHEEIYSETGGAETLANILNHMDRNSEDNILNTLGSNAPDLLEDVREMLYTFEELINLNMTEVRLLVSRVDDDHILSTALRGAGDEMRRHFFNGVSQNRAADLLEEIERRGPVSIREVNDARQFIVNVARRLDDEGGIVIKKDKDEYI